MISKKASGPTDVYVGARLRMRRKMLGMSQQALGEALGVTFQQVQKYESGANRIGASRLQHIAHVLRVPIAFFFEDVRQSEPERDDGATSPACVIEFLATGEGLALARAFSQVRSAPLRRSIVRMVHHITSEELPT
jgi:transcriptional regulator with XRE-family HTH domain